MFKRAVAVGICCWALAGAAEAATVASSKGSACKLWAGRYSGKLLESQNLFGQPEDVSVIIAPGNITVQIWGADAPSGGFIGSAVTAQCTSKSLHSTLDTGAEGKGKISLVMTRDTKVHLRLHRYVEGVGPNKAGYLPPERLEIPLREER